MDTTEIRDYNSLKKINNNNSFVIYPLQLDLNLFPEINLNLTLRNFMVVLENYFSTIIIQEIIFVHMKRKNMMHLF